AEILITEKLARQCRTEGQLAAVLCFELGRVVSERAGAAAVVPDRGPPPDVPVGKDYGGAVGPPPATRLMGLAKYERKRERQKNAAPPPPADLARQYLQKAGYPAADFDAVAPLLRAAEGHTSLEKQLTAPLPK